MNVKENKNNEKVSNSEKIKNKINKWIITLNDIRNIITFLPVEN